MHTGLPQCGLRQFGDERCNLVLGRRACLTICNEPVQSRTRLSWVCMFLRFGPFLLIAVLALPALAQAPSNSSPSNGGLGNGVPVTTVTPRRQDVPVTLRTIGTVQAFQSVNVRARVDGTLDRVLFTEGQAVKAGDLLAELDPRPYRAVLEQAIAKRASDEATLSNARSDLQRYSELAQTQAASRQKLDLQRAAQAQAEAAVRGSEASISAALINLNFTKITAPIDGRVGLRAIDVGNYIRAADPSSTGIVSITQIHPIALMFTLPQDQLPALQAALRRGKPAVVANSSDDKIRLSEGEVMTVDNAIDATTGTIRVKAQFANTDDRLWPGQFVNVRVRIDTRQDAMTIPSEAVQRGPAGLFVYVVKPDQTAAQLPVDVTQDDGQLAVIGAGLMGTEAVVLTGQSRLFNGARTAPTARPAT